MLSPPDEYFTHQVSFPHAMVGSSDPSWRERYWLSLQDVASGETVLSFGFGHYPNQDVQEAFACVAHRGRQHNVRMARRLSPASHVMQVGPMAAEVVKAYEQLHFTLDENESGLSFDLDWLGSFAPYLEERHFETAGSRVTHDLVRYVQLGRGRARLRVGDEELVLEPSAWWGERDHSWGMRPLPRVEGAPPQERPDWRFLLFLPVQFPDWGLHLYLFEDGEGHPTHVSCGLMGAAGAERVSRVTHDLRWEPEAATPTLVGGGVDIEFWSGRGVRLELTAKPGRAHLRGGGYGGIDGWFQGHWKGEESLVHEVWDLSDRSKLRSWGANSSDHLMDVRCDGEAGHGIAEYMVLPGHHRYGHVRG